MAVAAAAAPHLAAPADASAASYGERTLKRGMSGRDVRTAQVLLRRVGARLTVDNSFGPATERALRRFERAARLAADGRLTRREGAALRQKADEAVAARRAKARASEPDEQVQATLLQTTAVGTDSGGASPADPIGIAGESAVINPDGTATAPASAPQQVKDIIAAGNEIHDKPYKYGGGHGRWNDSGYDCSGSVSYALYGAGLLDASMPSGGFESWGETGKGQWVTIYANGGHMYMVVAGLRFDTSGAKPSRWQTEMRSGRGYKVRHPAGL